MAFSWWVFETHQAFCTVISVHVTWSQPAVYWCTKKQKGQQLQAQTILVQYNICDSQEILHLQQDHSSSTQPPPPRKNILHPVGAHMPTNKTCLPPPGWVSARGAKPPTSDTPGHVANPLSWSIRLQSLPRTHSSCLGPSHSEVVAQHKFSGITQQAKATAKQQPWTRKRHNHHHGNYWRWHGLWKLPMNQSINTHMHTGTNAPTPGTCTNKITANITQMKKYPWMLLELWIQLLLMSYNLKQTSEYDFNWSVL